jgi:hypothetical protein
MTTVYGPTPKRRRVDDSGAIRYHGPEDTCSVYRIHNAEDEVIYIGMSHEPAERVREHRRLKPWADEIAGHEADWYPDRAAAQAAEAKAIRKHQPKYNVVHTPELRRRIQRMDLPLARRVSAVGLDAIRQLHIRDGIESAEGGRVIVDGELLGPGLYRLVLPGGPANAILEVGNPVGLQAVAQIADGKTSRAATIPAE